MSSTSSQSIPQDNAPRASLARQRVELTARIDALRSQTAEIGNRVTVDLTLLDRRGRKLINGLNILQVGMFATTALLAIGKRHREISPRWETARGVVVIANFVFAMLRFARRLRT